MSLKRMLADADPTTAARAAVVMARATVDEPTVSMATRNRARQIIDLGPERLADRIRAARKPGLDDGELDTPDEASVAKDDPAADLLDKHQIDREQSAAIREWARRNGHNVSTRGRIPADVVDKFRDAHEGHAPERLTAQEREMAALLAEGLSVREIGRRVRISTAGVCHHLERVRRKLDLPDERALVDMMRSISAP